MILPKTRYRYSITNYKSWKGRDTAVAGDVALKVIHFRHNRTRRIALVNGDGCQEASLHIFGHNPSAQSTFSAIIALF